MIVDYTQPARVRFAPACHLLALLPTQRTPHPAADMGAVYLRRAPCAMGFIVRQGVPESAGKIYRSIGFVESLPVGSRKSHSWGTPRHGFPPGIATHCPRSAGEEREARVGWGLQRALSSGGGGLPLKDLRSSRAPFLRNIALPGPHSEDQRSSRVRFRSHSETLRVSRTSLLQSIVPPMAISDVPPERNSSIARCTGHHGPLSGDMPREKADPRDKPGPAPPSSGQGKTGTGFQQSGAIHPSKDEMTGKLPNLEKPAQNQERREGDLNSRGARHQRLSRHIAHSELKNTLRMNAHRGMIMR